MITRASGVIVGQLKRTAEFLLAHAAFAVGVPAVLVHGQSRVARRIAAHKKRQILFASPVERDVTFALIQGFNSVIDVFRIIALVGDECAFINGKE